MANNVLIQDYTIRELSSGELGPFSFKASSGKLFIGPPELVINGSQWDNSSGSVLSYDDTATDFSRLDRDGNGIYGTQTFIVTLKYDIGDIECRQEPMNEAYIDFPTANFPERCISNVGLQQIAFSVSRSGGDYPIFDGWFWPKSLPSGFIYEPLLYPSLALGTATYSFQIGLEANAMTFYSANTINGGAPFTISSNNSKTVTVNTSVYSGSIDIYWGTVTVVVNGDFIEGSMIFDNGLRGTANWVIYKDSCVSTPGDRNVWVSDSIVSIIKVAPCEFLGGGPASYQPNLVAYSGQTQRGMGSNVYDIPKSATNAYSWGIHRVDTESYKPGGAVPIEPYGVSYQRGDATILTVYNYAIIRRSEDKTRSFQTSTDSLVDVYRGYISQTGGNVSILDVAYAGVNASNQHVWYCLTLYRPQTSSAANNQILVSVSTDDGKTFSEVEFFNGTNNGFEDLKNSFRSYQMTGQANIYPKYTNWGRLHASIEHDYLFIECKEFKHSGYPYQEYELYRYFPSQTGVSNAQADIRLAFRFYRTNNPTKTFNTQYYTEFNEYDANLGTVNNFIQIQGPSLAVEPSGLCVVTGDEVYAASWNFGLNWVYEVDLSNYTITQAHSSNASLNLTYPEGEPQAFTFNGELYMYSGVQYYNHNNMRNASNLNSGEVLRDGLMRPVINHTKGLVTGEVGTSWSDQEVYGSYPNLPSSTFGPYNQMYANVGANSYGNGKSYFFANYQLDLDATYQNQYWFTYNFKTDATIQQQHSNGTGWGFYPRSITSHGNDVYFSVDPNSPTVTTRNTLHKSTDDMLSQSLVHTFPTSNQFIYFICEYDGSTDNFLAHQSSGGSNLYYSTNASTFQSVSNLSNLGNGVSWNTATVSKQFYVGGNCCIENGYMYLLDDTRGTNGGTLGRSYVVPVSEIGDASTWSNYEVTSQLLNDNNRYFGVANIQAIGSKAMAVYAYTPNGWSGGDNRPIYISTNNGTTWTTLTLPFTDNQGNTWTAAQLEEFGTLQKNHYGEQFLFQRQTNGIEYNKAGTNNTWRWNQALWTKDFVNWDFAEWAAEDPNNDSYGLQTWGTIANTGDDEDFVYTFRKNVYTESARKVVISNSQSSSSPVISDIISSWRVAKEYVIVTESERQGSEIYGYFTNGYYEDYNTPSGDPMLLINHIWSVSTWPQALAPTIANEPTAEIIPPSIVVDPNDLEYTAATVCRKMRYQSDQAFTIIYTKNSGQLVQFDGVFDITVYTITTPITIEGFANQTINILHDETLDRIFTQPNASDPNYSFYMNSEKLGLHIYYDSVENRTFAAPWNFIYDFDIYHTNDRSKLLRQASVDGEEFRKQLTYENNFAIPVPLGFDLASTAPIFSSATYGDFMMAFPPKDRLLNDLVGMKIFADLDGRGYPDGYYWVDNVMGGIDWGPITEAFTDGDWPWSVETARESTYMYIKNGFVTELGNAKDLPNYDRC